MRKHLLAAGFLATTAVSAAQIVVSIKHQRQSAHLATAQMHQALLADQAANPGLTKIWSFLEPVEEAERVTTLHMNRWVTMWGLAFRMGVFPRQMMLHTLRDFMRAAPGRAFWELVRRHRIEAARDAHDKRFNALMDEAYDEATLMSAA